MIYLICAIICVVVVAFFWIRSLVKKNKSLKFKLDFAEREHDSMVANVKNYKALIVKLNNRKVESETVKNNINNATGDELLLLVNSL